MGTLSESQAMGTPSERVRPWEHRVRGSGHGNTEPRTPSSNGATFETSERGKLPTRDKKSGPKVPFIQCVLLRIII